MTPLELAHALKHSLIGKLGYSVSTKADCRHLSQQISQATGKAISESTLYRLFLAKNTPIPYKHTLEIIANYLGYADLHAFEAHWLGLQAFELSYGKIPSVNKPSLLYRCIHNRELKSVRDFLFDISPDTPQPYIFRLGHDIAEALLTNSDNKPVFAELAQIPIVRQSVFELNNDTTFSIPDYEFGLLEYLKTTPAIDLLEHVQAKMFAQQALFRYYYLTKQSAKAHQMGQQLFQSVSLNDIHLLAPYPRARQVAYPVWYALLHEDTAALNAAIEHVLHYCEIHHEGWDDMDMSIHFNVIAEVLCSVPSVPGGQQLDSRLRGYFLRLYRHIPAYLYSMPLERVLDYVRPSSWLNHRAFCSRYGHI